MWAAECNHDETDETDETESKLTISKYPFEKTHKAEATVDP